MLDLEASVIAFLPWASADPRYAGSDYCDIYPPQLAAVCQLRVRTKRGSGLLFDHLVGTNALGVTAGIRHAQPQRLVVLCVGAVSTARLKCRHPPRLSPLMDGYRQVKPIRLDRSVIVV